MLDEFLHLAAALADQADHDHVGAGVARHHAEQHALADAGAGEQAHALAAPDGQQRVDRAHAHIQYLIDRFSIERIQRLRCKRSSLAYLQWPEPIQWAPCSIEHSS